MKLLCDTRCACRYEAVRALQANLQVVVELLDALIKENSSQAKVLAEARGLLLQKHIASWFLSATSNQKNCLRRSRTGM